MLSVNISENPCLGIIVYNACGSAHFKGSITEQRLGLEQPQMCCTHAAWIYLQEGDEWMSVDGLLWVWEVTRIRLWSRSDHDHGYNQPRPARYHLVRGSESRWWSLQSLWRLVWLRWRLPVVPVGPPSPR